MKIYLIRHAETVHNVGQAWAGTTDSPLTNHGVLQIQHLARYFRSSAINFTHVFASDLKRATLTAEGICKQQQRQQQQTPIVTPLLREQYFGSREGVSIRQTLNTKYRGADTGPTAVIADVIPAETEMSMRTRANKFLEEYLFPVLFSHNESLDDDDDDDDAENCETAVAIVGHGIILRVLWNCLFQAFPPGSVHFTPEVAALCRGGTLVPFWSNTGYMVLSIRRYPAQSLDAAMEIGTPSVTTAESPLSGWSIMVLSLDEKSHLRDLRRTGGGIGSSQHDTKQKSIESFFRR